MRATAARARRSRTRSLSLWIVALTGPSSTSSRADVGDEAAVGRAAGASTASACAPVSARSRRATASTSLPRRREERLAPTRSSASVVVEAMPAQHVLEARDEALARALGRVAPVEHQLERAGDRRWSRRCRHGCSSTGTTSAGSTRCPRPMRSRRARRSPARRDGSDCATCCGIGDVPLHAAARRACRTACRAGRS